MSGKVVKKDYQKAFKWLELAANQGSIRAQALLGSMYFEGAYGVKQNIKKAFELLKKPAEKGNTGAQIILSQIYLRGDVVKQDYAMAVKLLKMAHNKGDKLATRLLAGLYFMGKGVKKDYKKAFDLHLLAASLGEVNSMYALGLFYEYNFKNVIVKDYKEAYKWYKKAAEHGNLDAKKSLRSLCYKHPNICKKNYKKTKNLSSKAIYGKKLYAKCISCHGANGKTRALGKSKAIAGQSKEELINKLKAYKINKRNISGMGSLMAGQVKSLSDKDIEALANYISTL